MSETVTIRSTSATTLWVTLNAYQPPRRELRKELVVDGMRLVSPSGRINPWMRKDCRKFGALVEDGFRHVDRTFPWPYRKDGRINQWYRQWVEEEFEEP